MNFKKLVYRKNFDLNNQIIIIHHRFISIKDSLKVMRITQNEEYNDKLKLNFEAPKDEDELKKIYLILARVYHPDNKDSGNKLNFQQL